MKTTATSLLFLALLQSSTARFSNGHSDYLHPRAGESSQATEAPVLSSSPGRSYVATFNADNNDHGIKGTVKIASNSKGHAKLIVHFDSLPSDQHPGVDKLPFHIHEHSIASLANGTHNCTSAGPHFDPYKVGENITCNAEQPQTCQLGDLSGKYGALAIEGSAYQHTVYDKYLSTTPGKGDDAWARAFIGKGRSVVVHGKNKTRLACVNLIEAEAELPLAALSTTLLANPSQAAGDDNVPSTIATQTTTAGGCASNMHGTTSAVSPSGAPYPQTNSTGLMSSLLTAPGTAPPMPTRTDLSSVTVPVPEATQASSTTTGRGPAQATGAGVVTRPLSSLMLAMGVGAGVLGALGL